MCWESCWEASLALMCCVLGLLLGRSFSTDVLLRVGAAVGTPLALMCCCVLGLLLGRFFSTDVLSCVGSPVGRLL